MSPSPRPLRKAVPFALFLAAWLSPAMLLAAPEESPFLIQVKENFQRWDADRNGILELPEIDRAVVSPEVTGEAAATAAALRRAARSKTNPLPPLSLEKIDELSRTGVKATENGHGDAKPTNFKTLYESSLKKINSTPREVFVSGRPQLDGFRQGRLGTCYCLAPLSALIHRDGAEVARLFSSGPDGSIRVTFGDGRQILVEPLTDGELALASGTNNDGVWAALYEKAIGHLRTMPSKPSPTDPYGPLMIAGRGGPTGEFLSILTGREVKSFSTKPWRATPAKSPEELETELNRLRDMILENMQQSRLMVASSPSSEAAKIPSLSWNHAYAVIRLDPQTDLLTIRDPHGQSFRPKGEPGLTNGYEVKNGYFSAPLGEMARFMSTFSFEQATPRKVLTKTTTSAPVAR